MITKPKISYLALSFNHQDYLLETLNSIKSQDNFVNSELIIWDDGSTDDSKKFILQWAEKNSENLNVKLFLNDENIGLCKSLNICCEKASGEWIKLIACDDVLNKNYVKEFLITISENPNSALFCSDISIMDSDSKIQIEEHWKYSSIEPTKDSINNFENLLKAQYLHAPSLIFKKELWEKINGFDENLYYEDWDFLLKAKREFEFCFSNKSLVKYRVHYKNMHQQIDTNENYINSTIQLLLKHKDIGFNKILKEKIIEQICNLLIVNEDKAIEIWKNEFNWLVLNNTNFELISVLLPVYNTQNFIENTLNCILLQTNQNFEIVAIDDGSTDDSLEILKKISRQDNRIKIIENNENLGLINSLNKGLEQCNGKYIVRMDSDDLIAPNRFELLVKEIEYKNVDAVSSWMVCFDNNNTFKIIKYRSNMEELKLLSFFYSPVSHAASIFKSDILKDLKYDVGFSKIEDYNLWIRFFKRNYKISIIDKPLYFYRQHQEQVTNIFQKQNFLNFNKISELIFKWWKIDYTDKDLKSHSDLVLLQLNNLKSKNQFFVWDSLLNKTYLSLKKSNVLNYKKFSIIVFKNYWLSNYNRFYSDFTFSEKLRMCFSLMNIQNTAKQVIKVIINKI